MWLKNFSFFAFLIFIVILTSHEEFFAIIDIKIISFEKNYHFISTGGYGSLFGQ